MDLISDKCNICLKSCERVIRIVECDENGTQIITKLKHVVSEVDWSEDYNICGSCIECLNQSYDFRIACIALDEERRSSLKIELEQELKSEIFNCFHCNDGFEDKEILFEHIQEKHTQILGESQDNKSFITKTGKRLDNKHIKNRDKTCKTKKVKRKTHSISCEVCSIKLNYAKSIVKHCVEVHSLDAKLVKPFTCDECPMRFSTSANLIQHKKYHEGSRTHICSFCGKTFITKSDLTVHEYTHYNRRNYKCEFCEKAFNTNKNLRSHILVVHTPMNLWKHECTICNRRFPLKSGFEQHMRRHTGDKRFVCHICEKPFVSRSEMQKHLGYHSKARPFKCEHCDKLYKESRFYKIHLAKEHGIGDAKIPVREKKFVCHICPSTFYDKPRLTRHLCTHTGVKPFECAHCDKKFSDKYYFKHHLKVVHKVEDGEAKEPFYADLG